MDKNYKIEKQPSLKIGLVDGFKPLPPTFAASPGKEQAALLLKAQIDPDWIMKWSETVNVPAISMEAMLH